MNIYDRKFNFKIILLLLGILIALVTFLYSNYLSGEIEREEKAKAKLWAEAIERKAKLVKYTKELFETLSDDQRTKVNVLAQSLRLILNADDNETLNFFNEVITSNNDIPVVLTDEKGVILSSKNIDMSLYGNSLLFEGKLKQEFSLYTPILVNYGKTKNYIYYKDSNLFSRLKKNLNDLVETFISEVVVNSVSAPVVMLDENGKVIAHSNVDSLSLKNPAILNSLISEMNANHLPIEIDLGEGVIRKIHYDDSHILKMLRYAPYIQIAIFVFFLLVSYLAFSTARKAEQNLVWVGMAKETAHQLGTPISSLSSWVEYFKESDMYSGREEIVNELEQDVNRLSLVADRFSKIGSEPQLASTPVRDAVSPMIDYMKRRSSEKVTYNLFVSNEDLRIDINQHLFDWVIENLLKNSLDAMEGKGDIDIQITDTSSDVLIDVSDSGKGIPANKFNTIFEPGFSTKRRGWGLGLSLTKRIVTEYHNGEIFVKNSTVGKGTTIRIKLPKSKL